MFLPLRLLATELQRHGCLPEYLQYQKHLKKIQNSRLRIAFLQKCKHSGIIPRFLKFRIPNNGCFEEKTVHEFQIKLVRRELIQAKEDLKSLLTQLNVKRVNLQKKAPDNCLPSIVVYTRLSCERIRKQVTQTHSRKLGNLSEEQSKPLFTVKNTVRLCNIDKVPPKYVLETLSLGPKTLYQINLNKKTFLQN